MPVSSNQDLGLQPLKVKVIFEQALIKERQEKWHTAVDSRPLRTLDDAREFLNSIGFCLAYPLHPAALAPTFIGAYVASEEKLPTAKLAFSDANARAATELVVRLLSEKSAFEVAFGEDGSLLVSAAEFPYFYALIGDRNPKAAPNPGIRGEQALTTHTFQVIDASGPISEDEMRRKLGREISRNAIEKVLHALWSKLRITRVDSGLDNGEPVEPVWDLMHRFAPHQVNRGKQISAAEALSALISKYLETVVSAEQKDVEDFFGRFVPRSKVTEVCKALLAAQEFTFVQVSGKTMLRLASRGGDSEGPSTLANTAGREVHRVRPWQARELGKKAAEEKRAKYAERAPSAFQKFAKDRPAKPFGEKKSFGERRPFADRGPKKFGDRKTFGEGKRFSERKSFGGERKSFGDRPRFPKDRPPHEAGASGDFKRPLWERKSFGDSPKPFGERKNFGGKNRPSHGRERFAKRPGAGFTPRGQRAEGDKRGFKKDYPPRRGSASSGEKRGSAAPRGDRPARTFSEKKSFGAKRPFDGKRSSGDKKPFGKLFGSKKSFDKRKHAGGERPSPPRTRERKPPEGSEE